MDRGWVNSERLRATRLARRMPVQDLADAVGISRAYLTHLELGSRKRCSFTVLDALEDRLGLARGDLQLPAPAASAVGA